MNNTINDVTGEPLLVSTGEDMTTASRRSGAILALYPRRVPAWWGDRAAVLALRDACDRALGDAPVARPADGVSPDDCPPSCAGGVVGCHRCARLGAAR